MSEKPVISPENQPTAIAAVFILTLLTLAFTMYNYRRTNDVAAFYGGISMINAKKTAEVNASVNRLADLEKRIEALEAAAKTAPAVPPPPAPVEPAAPAKK